MPQLMPLYWVMSTIMIMLLFMMILKINANYLLLYEYSELKMNYEENMWYW